MTDARPSAPACYRHPDRPALLRCTRCERPICADDAIEAPVGYQCPECAKGAVPARRLTELGTRPDVTRGLLVVIGVVFVLTQVGELDLINRFALRPALVGDGAWWLLITSAFLHANLMHVGFNGILLWRLGEMLEGTLGGARFGALYLAGLAGGSLGVMLTSWLWTTRLAEVPVLGAVLTTHPGVPTVGASGAVFALMGAAMAGMRERGVDPWRTDIGGLVLLNLIITFAVPGISVGGHVGGLLTGLAIGRLLFVPRQQARARAAMVAGIGLALLAGAWAMGASLLARALRMVG